MITRQIEYCDKNEIQIWNQHLKWPHDEYDHNKHNIKHSTGFNLNTSFTS